MPPAALRRVPPADPEVSGPDDRRRDLGPSERTDRERRKPRASPCRKRASIRHRHARRRPRRPGAPEGVRRAGAPGDRRPPRPPGEGDGRSLRGARPDRSVDPAPDPPRSGLCGVGPEHPGPRGRALLLPHRPDRLYREVPEERRPRLLPRPQPESPGIKKAPGFPGALWFPVVDYFTSLIAFSTSALYRVLFPYLPVSSPNISIARPL